MRNKAILIPVVLLVITIGNYSRLDSPSNIRTIEYLYLLVIGALSGVLIVQIAMAIKGRKK